MDSQEPSRAEEFSNKKPLPPIGQAEDQEAPNSDSQTTDKSKQEDDNKSITSTSAFDRPGEGSARPRIIRGFRPEAMSDDDTDDDHIHRSVSFSDNLPMSVRRKAFDGRETTFVTLETQTDWDWVEKVEQTGTAKIIDTDRTTQAVTEKEKTSVTPRSPSSKQETPEDKAVPEAQPFQMPYNDEYGIPILDLSSDTDDLIGSKPITPKQNKKNVKRDRKSSKKKSKESSDDEITHKKMKDDRIFLPSIGPPNILQVILEDLESPRSQDSAKPVSRRGSKVRRSSKYQRESEKHDIDVDEPATRMDLLDYDLDDRGLPHGMFSGKCEFCNKEIKPFPSVEQQKKYPPESLYCCNDYREFVEFVISTSTEMEEEQKKKNKLISIKPHEHVGSKQERNAAKEKAVQRMRERELMRKQQEASGMQQNFFALGPGGTSRAGFIRAPGGIGNVTMKDMFVGGGTSTSTPKRNLNTLSLLEGSAASSVSSIVSKEALSTVKVDPNEVDYECFPGCPASIVPRIRTQLMQRFIPKGKGGIAEPERGEKKGEGELQVEVKHSRQCDVYRTAQYTVVFLDQCREFDQVARQMKTINYQLSSQKCLEEGWTLRAPSPLFDEDGDDVFIPEPLNPAMIEDGKLRHRPLIEKFYDSGQKFLTMFPDGTGNVFYPSGNLAILISSVKLGQYYYTIHQDMKRSWVVAAFEPNGYGYCYYPNGDIRLYIDQYGGMELDSNGGKKRKWSWKDQVTHVHAPPFQPICIGVNKNIGLRVMSQENISLTFSCNRRGCRFNMGSRLKLVAPENAPLKEVQEEYIFLEEKKNAVESLLDKVANLLKFPNHPKIDKMLPPLHVTSKMNKTEKMKKDRKTFLAQQTAREKRQNPLAVN